MMFSCDLCHVFHCKNYLFDTVQQGEGKENNDCSNAEVALKKDHVDTELKMQGLLDDLMKSVK